MGFCAHLKTHRTLATSHRQVIGILMLLKSTEPRASNTALTNAVPDSGRRHIEALPLPTFRPPCTPVPASAASSHVPSQPRASCIKARGRNAARCFAGRRGGRRAVLAGAAPRGIAAK
eukprot:6175878-Pleurochrysis_carterae.AAC.1